MTDPTPIREGPAGSALRYALVGGLLGAVQPLVLAVIAVWMKVEDGAAPHPLTAGPALGLRYVLPSAVLAAIVGYLTHSAYARFGREALVPFVLTYAFLAIAFQMFLFLAPA